jgi:hypothetical protein
MMRINRYLLAFCAILVAFGLIVAGYYKVMFDIQRKRAETAAAEIKATRQALEAANVYTEKTVIIREKGNAATQRIYKAPNADSPVPDGVLSAWRDGIGRLRDDSAEPADPASVQGAVQGAGG